MTPMSRDLLFASFPPDPHGAAVRDWTAIGRFAAASGCLVGGLLVTISWRWILVGNAASPITAKIAA